MHIYQYQQWVLAHYHLQLWFQVVTVKQQFDENLAKQLEPEQTFKQMYLLCAK